MLVVWVQDRELFGGDVIHACELTSKNLHIAEGKRVLVVGAGKSAIDACVAATEVSASVTNVFRQVSICQ